MSNLYFDSEKVYTKFGVFTSIFLLLSSAIFSFAETCLTTCNKNRITRDATSGNKAAKTTLNLLKHKDRTVSTIIFGNTLINILLASITTNESISIFGEKYVLITSLIVTFVILIFAEVLPKNFALINPEDSALKISGLMNFIVKLFYPVTFVLQTIVSGVFSVFGFSFNKNKSSFISDIKDLVAAYKDDENIAHSMIHGVSDINIIKVGQIMIHRKNVMLMDINLLKDNLNKILDEVLESTYSRIPVTDGSDNIIGILHTKDLAKYFYKNQSIKIEDIKSMVRKPIFVYENISLGSQLNRFKEDRSHIAIVVDEYSVFLGIITLEDIMERIVGQIYDEHDTEYEGDFSSCSDETCNEIIIKGDLPIGDLVKNWDIHIPDHEEYTTVAGYIIENLERIPNENEMIEIGNYKFIIEKIENNSIVTIRILKP